MDLDEFSIPNKQFSASMRPLLEFGIKKVCFQNAFFYAKSFKASPDLLALGTLAMERPPIFLMSSCEMMIQNKCIEDMSNNEETITNLRCSLRTFDVLNASY